MANDTPLRDPAYQLYFQESLELLLQIDTTLQEVLHIPSKKSMDFLLEMIQTLHQGAQSLDLPQLSNAAQIFERLMFSFRQDPLAATPDDAERLKRAYKDVQVVLASYLPSPAELAPSPDEDFSQHKSVESVTPSSELSLPIVSDDNCVFPEGSGDVTSLMLTTDVAEILEQLQQVLLDPQVYDLVDELRTHTEALLGWGEVLELSEFIVIAQSTLGMLESNPRNAVSIGQLSLSGFRGAYREALQALQIDFPFQSTSEGSKPLRPGRSENTIAEIPTAESLSSADEVVLDTTLLFVWQQETLLFTIPSDAVVEISIPRAEQMMGNEHQRCLSWQQQFIPIHSLVHLLDQGEVNWPRLSIAASTEGMASSTVFSASPLIIVQQGEQTLALEVDITRLVTEPELMLHIPEEQQKHCPYFCGDTTLEAGHEYGVIDVMTLLNDTLELSLLPVLNMSRLKSAGASRPARDYPVKPAKKTRSQTTILIVDDSQTVRMMVSIALQSAGYQILEAADGQLAIEQLQQHPDIHLVLCDVEMPNMNGFEFLKHRCRYSDIAHIPVVMLSTCGSHQHQHLANTLGANAYLTKPYEESNLLATLQALIR